MYDKLGSVGQARTRDPERQSTETLFASWKVIMRRQDVYKYDRDRPIHTRQGFSPFPKVALDTSKALIWVTFEYDLRKGNTYVSDVQLGVNPI